MARLMPTHISILQIPYLITAERFISLFQMISSGSKNRRILIRNFSRPF
ncbi:MAG: hypothetical protein HOK17_09385 [Flammeovirgaceae bacterium]|nr:hypothetical protein [Flammeovirgaceae bacterium]